MERTPEQKMFDAYWERELPELFIKDEKTLKTMKDLAETMYLQGMVDGLNHCKEMMK